MNLPIPPPATTNRRTQIALGTIILLAGVLCLSWRLQDEAQTIKTGSALTPDVGGFIDTDEDDVDDGDETSFITSSVSTELPTPPIRRPRRALSQAEEIWGELQDDDADESTNLLRKPPGRRKTSYGFPRTSATASRSQDATGGWWRLKWWPKSRRQSTSSATAATTAENIA
jgi:hypothetical protein